MQNIATLSFTDAQVTAIESAMTELETQFASLVSIGTKQRISLKKMGPKSETFCRQTLHVLEQNPQMVPPNLGLADAATCPVFPDHELIESGSRVG